MVTAAASEFSEFSESEPEPEPEPARFSSSTGSGFGFFLRPSEPGAMMGQRSRSEAAFLRRNDND